MVASTIASGLKQLLAAYMPFSSMAPEDLDFLIQHVEVAYFEPGETVLSPADGLPPYYLDDLIGHVLVKDLREDDTIMLEALGQPTTANVGRALSGSPART